MQTSTITLTREKDAFIEDAARSGDYSSKSDAVGHALLLLERRRKRRAAKVEWLRGLIDEGIAELDAGKGIEINGTAALEAWMDGLGQGRR